MTATVLDHKSFLGKDKVLGEADIDVSVLTAPSSTFSLLLMPFDCNRFGTISNVVGQILRRQPTSGRNFDMGLARCISAWNTNEVLLPASGKQDLSAQLLQELPYHRLHDLVWAGERR